MLVGSSTVKLASVPAALVRLWGAVMMWGWLKLFGKAIGEIPEAHKNSLARSMTDVLGFMFESELFVSWRGSIFMVCLEDSLVHGVCGIPARSLFKSSKSSLLTANVGGRKFLIARW